MALVITRTIDGGDKAVVDIGDDIEVRVLSHKRGQVVLSIDAPDDVTILRREVERRKGRQ